MIKSMTGFGRGEAIFAERVIAIELRTLNSKQLDLSLRVPSIYKPLEADLRALCTRRLVRGKCEFTLNFSSQNERSASQINSAIFAAYCRQAQEALKEAGIDEKLSQASALELLRLPDVVSCEAQSLGEAEAELILSAASEALDRLDEFRLQEGAILAEDLLARIACIEENLKLIEPFEQTRIEQVRAKLREHIERERIEVDNNRFEQEMIYHLERLDINEEKVRLRAHCNYFREVLGASQSEGRKLGFIAQEMGREINTIGSKSNNANMQRHVVQMKDELEKIKEQVLNIL